ncbi:MAG TPA: type II secretion system F family protein [Candidatus Paceibacterota bacterium]|nr:type II secretion system F family protein [Candidatus Paceibacterota bacterium]
MARFAYKAEKNDGEIYTGVAEAQDRFELYQVIRREGGRVLSVEEKSSGGIRSLEYWNLLLTRIKEYDKILFARNLGAMIGAGLPLTRALSVMQRQTKNIKLVNILAEIESSVRRGDPLHVALAKFPTVFPDIFIAMVKAGQESGKVSDALSMVADQMERIYDLKRKIKSAMIYPCIILVAIVGIGILMMIKVVPTLAQTFEQSHLTLPLSTRIIIATSNILVAYTWEAILGMVALVALLYFGTKTKAGKHITDFTFLHMPIIGELVREINAARTARTLASLRAAGVDVVTSLQITSEVVQNVYFRRVISEAIKEVRAGVPLSVTFQRREDLYPAFVGEMMAVGEETGETNDMLRRLALYYEDQVDRKTKDMSTIIEPFLMIIIGGAVGFFAVSMIAPIYQLTGSIN